MISAFTSLTNCSLLTAFTLPAVPTGMKMGVWISPWSVIISPVLAFECRSCSCIWNFNVGMRKYRPRHVDRTQPTGTFDLAQVAIGPKPARTERCVRAGLLRSNSLALTRHEKPLFPAFEQTSIMFLSPIQNNLPPVQL